MELKIEYVDIDSIKPYKNNAKQHPREQIEQIKKSIEEFEMVDPIGIWKDEIVEGHGRLIACKELGYKEVPIIRLDHLTDEERKAYTLVHNKLTMNSDFDIDILESELEDLSKELDMSEFGFDANILDSEEFGTDFSLPDGEKEPFMQMTFTLSNEQAKEINEIIKDAKKQNITRLYNNYDNNNDNGNALYAVCKEWEKQKI